MKEYRVDTGGNFKFRFNVVARDKDNAIERAGNFLISLEEMCNAAGYILEHECDDWEAY
jgi:hypothetical protein